TQNCKNMSILWYGVRTMGLIDPH
ncbi:uncharacterized protein METZ01_LOCUS485881, partial [marine metagenome]